MRAAVARFLLWFAQRVHSLAMWTDLRTVVRITARQQSQAVANFLQGLGTPTVCECAVCTKRREERVS